MSPNEIQILKVILEELKSHVIENKENLASHAIDEMNKFDKIEKKLDGIHSKIDAKDEKINDKVDTKVSFDTFKWVIAGICAIGMVSLSAMGGIGMYLIGDITSEIGKISSQVSYQLTQDWDVQTNPSQNDN